MSTVYQHVLAWSQALDEEGIALSVWRIHRKIGMSGGLLTNQLLRETGQDISEDRIARLGRLHAEAYGRLSRQIRPLPGARALLANLTEAFMLTGTVKWFNGTKDFGFIQPDDGGQDVFVYISAVEKAGLRDLADGQKISYEVVVDQRRGKASAENLRVG